MTTTRILPPGLPRILRHIPWLLALAALLLVLTTTGPAFGATSAQQVYETPETGGTPSPLPEIPRPPQGIETPILRNQPAPVAGTPAPLGPCIPGEGATPGSGAAPSPGAERCAPAPVDGTSVRNQPSPVVAGAAAPPGPCVEGEGATPGSGSAPSPGAEECASAPGSVTPVRNQVSPGPGEPAPVGEVRPAFTPAQPAASDGDTLPVTGLDLLLIAAAAAAAAGLGFSLRRAAR